LTHLQLLCNFKKDGFALEAELMAKDLVAYSTITGDWALAIHRVSNYSAEIWFGTLNAHLMMPKAARLVLMDEAQKEVATYIISADQWKRPFSKLNQRFYHLHLIQDLSPGTRYLIRFDRQLPESAGDFAGHWQDVCSGEFQTIPNGLPETGSRNFTIAFGSCFYGHRDEGKAAIAYKALYKNGPIEFRPNVTFLIGDQVYLDIGLDSFSFKEDEIWERIANDYENNWQLLGDILRFGGTWILPDDHEYWNNYPFYESLIPTLWPLKIESVRNATVAAATDGVNNIQRSLDVEIIEIGEDISICLTNFRSKRNKNNFIDPDNFEKIISWAKNLTTPGIIVCSQNLLDCPNGSEKNLTDYEPQYKALIEALGSTGNDIVSLSGDVHFGRIGTAELGSKGAKLIEIVSSPLSNLTGLGGFATAVADKKPKTFLTGVELKNPKYDGRYFVESTNADYIHGYPHERTKEHFMTLGLSKTDNGAVEIVVNAWLVRVMINGLPGAVFDTPFRTQLKSVK
jgi:hypothetical protein